MRLLPLLLIACATPPTTRETGGPRGLRASEHLDSARDHDERAREQRSYAPVSPHGSGVPETMYLRWDTSQDHRRLAQIHRSKAAQLQAAYDEACGMREYAEVSVSPLARYGLAGQPTKDGATMYLDPSAGAPVTLLADLRCHRAWMMLTPQPTMVDCPLDLPGLRVDVKAGEGSIIVVLAVEPKLVPELQRRVAKELELHRGHE